MRSVLFTKLFESRSAAEIGQVAAGLGFEGVDLLIRPGYTVDPEQVEEELPRAVRVLSEHGLSVPMATTDLTDVRDDRAARVFGACGQAGIEVVRLGYWTYDGRRRYAEVLEEARAQLGSLETVARSSDVRVAVQLHGGTIHASGVMGAALLAGRDPAYVGAYPDPGNQAVQGGLEDWRLTFDVLEPWLACVGVKNGGWFPFEAGSPSPSGHRPWRSEWMGIAEGMVAWPAIVAHLRDSGFPGLWSFHSHYERTYQHVLEQTEADLGYVHRLWQSQEVPA